MKTGGASPTGKRSYEFIRWCKAGDEVYVVIGGSGSWRVAPREREAEGRRESAAAKPKGAEERAIRPGDLAGSRDRAAIAESEQAPDSEAMRR
jgi:hypothetical protein